MKKILFFADYYLPGYKAGGPIRSIQSICDALGNKFDIYIVTRDHDFGNEQKYKIANSSNWVNVGKVKVMYQANSSLTVSFIKKILEVVKPDVVHLNSLMSRRFSFLPLLVLRFSKNPRIRVLLSPRGELSAGALTLKKFQKIIYLKLFCILRLDHNVDWIASSEGEKSDILGKFHKSRKVHRVDNFPNASQWRNEVLRSKPKSSNCLKLVFFSRITRMKNLNYLLDVLQAIDKNIQLSIYGPREDKKYLDICNMSIKKLPKNISVNFFGSIPAKDVYKTLIEYDLFVLPTLGENFGQAIWEALASSVPVLISNRTPWKNLELRGVGWDVSLDDSVEFKNVIIKMCHMDEREHKKMRTKCRNFAIEYIENSKSSKILHAIYVGNV